MIKRAGLEISYMVIMINNKNRHAKFRIKLTHQQSKLWWKLFNYLVNTSVSRLNIKIRMSQLLTGLHPHGLVSASCSHDLAYLPFFGAPFVDRACHLDRDTKHRVSVRLLCDSLCTMILAYFKTLLSHRGRMQFKIEINIRICLSENLCHNTTLKHTYGKDLVKYNSKTQPVL